MRREPVGTRGIAERGCSGSRDQGLRLSRDFRKDELQRERPVSGPVDAGEEPICVVAAGAEPQRDQSERKMLRDVTERKRRFRNR